MSHYVYVIAREENRVLVFSMAPDSGKLTLLRQAGLDGEPYTACFSPAQDSLYVTINVAVPTQLTREQRRLMEQMDEVLAHKIKVMPRKAFEHAVRDA